MGFDESQWLQNPDNRLTGLSAILPLTTNDAMELNRFTLSFTGTCRDLEAPFLESYFEQNLGHLRLWHIIAVTAYASGGFIEWFLFPEMLGLLWGIRFGLVSPFFLIGLVFSFSRLYANCWQAVSFFYLMATGISAIITMVLTPVPQHTFYYYSVITTLIFGYASIRERFVAATLAGWVLFIAFEVVVLRFGHNPYVDIVVYTYVLIIINFLGMVISYGVEFSARKDFFLNETLRQKNQELAVENKTRRRTEKKLIASLQEKETLFKEVHHRVKNNLQIISSLLDMTRYRSADKAVKDSLTGARTKIQTMAMIHTRLYDNNPIEKIAMGPQIKDLYSNLHMLYGEGRGIRFELEADEIHLNVAKAIPCALILNELISNAMKHAFLSNDKPTIAVSIAINQGAMVEITVRDNGIGLPQGIDFNQADTLGLKLVRVLVLEQLGGELEILRQNGTTFFFRFASEALS